ncbi:acyltransferase family protein [Vibrio cyclitrophicus]|uniref:acyltransferase family protein n=1 Tax=Vibrio cyclitrophicus TaxID=47951 RepID=UPI0032E37293
MNFRYDINSLRALAVFGVVLFHFAPFILPGGFAGVDVFFVLSGFLMTKIIFQSLLDDRFSLYLFYRSRAVRILPALIFLCFGMAIFGWFFLPPIDYQYLGKHILSSVLFFSNFIYWMESGYFDASSSEKWLLHTWSLSLEWQFYILFPILIILLFRFFSLASVKVAVLILCVLSFVFSIYTSYNLPNLSYYFLPSRAWELIIGGVAYLYPLNIKYRYRRIISSIGFSFILASYVLFSKDAAWPGFYAILPVFGAFLTLQANDNENRISSIPLIQKLGYWSYSIYLWHWPIVVYIYMFGLDKIYIVPGMLLSVLFGFFSYRYVESLKIPQIPFKLTSIFGNLLTLSLLAISLCGGLIFFYKGIDLPFRSETTSPKSLFLKQATVIQNESYPGYWLKCNTFSSLQNKGVLDVDPSCTENKGHAGVFLWGDSHAEALSLGLRTLLEPLDIDFYQKTSAGCRASLSDTTVQKGDFKIACDYSNKVALSSIKKIKPQLVIIAQANGHQNSDWIAIRDLLFSFGVKQILIVGPIPQWQPSLPRALIQSSTWKSDTFLSSKALDKSVFFTDNSMRGMRLGGRVDYVSLISELCISREQQVSCRVRTDSGDLLQFDYGHLSSSGSIFVVNNILSSEILRLL